MEATRDTSLATRLRHETAALHAQAERSGVMAALIAGTIERPAYVALLRNLHALYLALESALARHRTDPRLAFACAAPLLRAARIAQDLATLGRDVPAAPLAPAAERYVEHLAALAGREPLRLVAHAYVRYLGDLYGGQQLARGLRQRFELPPGQGTRFYDFGPAPGLPALRATFRAGLDGAARTPAQADAVIDEAQDAFRRHLALFDDLASA